MPIIGVIASGISGRLSVPTGYYSIATATVTSGGAPSITFSSIPTSYTHLELRWIGGDSRVTESMDDLAIQFNGDTTSGNYKTQRYYTKASTVTADSVDGYGCIFGWGSAGGRANSQTFGMGVALIPNYKSTNKKTVTAYSGMDNAPTLSGQAGGNQSMAGFWAGTSAINEIKIYGINGDLLENSKFHLYGIQ
jgi:hypothetical protein